MTFFFDTRKFKLLEIVRAHALDNFRTWIFCGIICSTSYFNADAIAWKPSENLRSPIENVMNCSNEFCVDPSDAWLLKDIKVGVSRPSVYGASTCRKRFEKSVTLHVSCAHPTMCACSVSIISHFLVILAEHLVCICGNMCYSRNHRNRHLINPCRDPLVTAAMRSSATADNSRVTCVQTIFAYALPHSMSTTLVGAYAVETSRI